MLLDILPNVNRVFALVAQQERQFSCENVSGSKAMMVSREGTSENRGAQAENRSTHSENRNSHHSSSGGCSSNYGGNKWSNKKCSYCGKMGHTVEDCYKKHGFPPGFKFKNPKYANRSANCVHSNEEDQDSQEAVSGQESTRFGFTADQYHHLLALLPPQEQKGSSSGHQASVNSCVQGQSSKNGKGSSQGVLTKNGFQCLEDDWHS
ncbi:uncharacterized protein LOC130714651 [Lotus japonicus]|uniref:uncharacterized protein LOC130714651 n=1 Tax=Lotus japonicus TaxID=34305 RepID=UPI0025905CDE|nr:uncharacterized protein LOC130714651 [Lotus japonicus]